MRHGLAAVRLAIESTAQWYFHQTSE